MSHSPTGATTASKEYVEGWSAIYELVRQGKSWSGRERNVAFLNTRDGGFADVSAVSGLDFLDDGRGLATADWDLDGSLDLWVTNRSDVRLRMLHNRDPRPHPFIAFRLQGTRSNRDAIGARVELRVADESHPRRVKVLAAGDGYLAQSSKWIHFGLGEETTIEDVAVRWPDGTVESFGALAPSFRYLLEEGAGKARTLGAPRPRMDFGPTPAREPSSTASGRTVLVHRLPLTRPEALAMDGTTVALGGGAPRLVTLWASWCPNCRREFDELARARSTLGDSGLEIWAVSVDEEETRGAAEDFLDDLSWPYDRAWATPELLTLLDAVQQVIHTQHGGMVLPTSFLLDRQGDLAVVYRGAMSVDTLLQDLALVESPTEEAREAAMPFKGRWATGPGGNATFELAALLTSHGDPRRAWTYLRDEAVVDRAPVRAREQIAGIYDRTALALESIGSRAESVEARRRAAEIQPTGLRFGSLGNAQAGMGRGPEALESLRRAADLSPDDPSIAVDLGLILAQSGELAAAQERFNAALEAAAFGTDAHCKALHNLAVAQGEGEGGDSGKAVEHAEAAVRCDEGAFDSWLYLGVLSHRQGALPAAIEAYGRAFELDPNDARLVFFLGRALIDAGDLTAAEEKATLLEAMGHRSARNLRREIEARRAAEPR